MTSLRDSAAKAPSSRTTKAQKDRQARKYGFACANCRRRKARCDGALPSCGRCLASNETCYFDKVPSVTYAVSLQNSVKASESLLNSLRDANDVDRLRLLEEYFSGNLISERRPSTTISEQHKDSPDSDNSVENDLTELLNETSVGEDGRICFYGKTSLYHLQPDQVPLSRPQAGEIPDTFYTPSPPFSISAQADVVLSVDVDITPDLCNELLEMYWCWPHHLHLVLCRKVFMRDMATRGPYVTPFLFNAVLAQGTRYSDRPEAPKLCQYFAQRALDSLAIEINKGSSIPLIQGLLILSARECACGRSAQGWLYSGMAFRMMQDMGIHIHPRKLSHLAGQFSEEELALRQQVFWSCYTWDKMMSLSLGRTPTIPNTMPVLTADMILDGEEAENETWMPKFSAASALESSSVQKSSSNSRFIAYCQLCGIIDEVLANLYAKPHATQNHLHDFLDRTIDKLEGWAAGLPSHLYVRQDSRVMFCPPLHILILNLFYHATVILLCRPFRSTQTRARKMATAAAEMIDRLFMLHIRRFGFRVINYMESYTIFVASTINILDLKEHNDEEGASARLSFNLEILRNSKSTPSNARCIEIIEQLLHKGGKRAAKEQHNTRQSVTQLDTGTVQTSQPAASTAQPLQFCPPNTQAAEVNDMSFLGANEVGFQQIYDQNYVQAQDSSGSMLPHRTNSFAVEAPLLWLPDNVGNDCRWMMMEMDFNTTLADSMSPAHGNVEQNQSDDRVNDP